VISGFYGVPLEDLAAAFTVESDKACSVQMQGTGNPIFRIAHGTRQLAR
jgi:hypothetical protein